MFQAILRIQADVMEIRGVMPTDEDEREVVSELGRVHIYFMYLKILL